MTPGWWMAGLLLAGLVLLAVLPPNVGCFPPCPVHTTTGLYCSGCGSLRAIRSLLSGDVLQAWHYNPILLCCIPIILVGVLSEVVHTKRLSLTRIRPFLLWVWLSVILAFGVLRNIPAFDYLQPTALSAKTIHAGALTWPR